MFIKNVCAIALAVCISVSAFAKMSSQTSELEIDFPCVIAVEDSLWVDAGSVTSISIMTWKDLMVVVWHFGKEYVYVKVINKIDAMDLIAWYDSEVERKCK